MENLDRLIVELCKLDNETPWVEFKHNNYTPEMIGQDISALANSAALYDRSKAYMVWGIDDTSHKIIGTKYDLQSLKKGNQELHNWLRSLLSDNADFEYHIVNIDQNSLLKNPEVANNTKVGVLIIYKATSHPVCFEKIDYIRVGSYTKKLRDYPELQGKLWDKLRNTRFEELAAKSDLSVTQILQLIDYSKYFDLKGLSIPSTIDGIIHYLLEEDIIQKQDNSLYSITNMGALLFAKNLNEFSRLSRKAIRVVQYEGKNRINMLKHETRAQGYAVGFEDLQKYIEALLPSKEVISGSLRERKTVYPSIAIRESLANTLIHQDFSVTGTGPVVEIFENRIEFTNAGEPLVDVIRIIDNPPKSRNEKLASLMRNLHICEELGTGWDKIVISCELFQLPAPRIEILNDNTRVTLFANIPYTNLTPEDKLWACYLHACIKHVQGECISNQTLRERFGLPQTSSASVSRLIKDALAIGMIKPVDPDTAPRYMKYIPGWA